MKLLLSAFSIFILASATAFAYPACTNDAQCAPNEICTPIFSNDRGTYCVDKITAMVTMHGENPDLQPSNNGTHSPCFTASTPTAANPTLDCQTLVRMGLMSDCGNTAANLNRTPQALSTGGMQPQFGDPNVSPQKIARGIPVTNNRGTASSFRGPALSIQPSFRMPGSDVQATMDREIKKEEKACARGSATACACLAKNKQGRGYYVYSKSWLWGETCTPVAF